jgi:hypothetical protein
LLAAIQGMEYRCGGTIATLVNQEHKVVLLLSKTMAPGQQFSGDKRKAASENTSLQDGGSEIYIDALAVIRSGHFLRIIANRYDVPAFPVFGLIAR